MVEKEIFVRGLHDDFIKRLNSCSKDKDYWWSKIKEDKALFIGIRDNYLNVYFHGCSLVKLSMLRRPMGRLRGETHDKYLGREGDASILSNDGVFNLETAFGIPQSLAELDLIKRNIKKHGEKRSRGKSVSEKSAIQAYIETPNDVIDLEVAVSKKRSRNDVPTGKGKKGGKIPRIDMVELSCQKGTGVAVLNFVEAKHIDNSELVTQGRKPNVICQMQRYQRLINQSEYRDQFVKVYLDVCKNRTALGLVEPGSLTAKVAAGKLQLEVNPNPRLLVFVTRQARPNWTDGANHEGKLRRHLDTLSCEYATFYID